MNVLPARKFYSIFSCAIAACSLSLAALAGGPDCKQRMTGVDAEGVSGQLTASDHAAHANKRFEAMDVDRSGRLTAAEIDASHGAESMVWAKRAISSSEKIRQLDSDGDGTLTRAEYAAGSQAMFRKLDANSDGTLSPAEMQTDNLTASRP